MRQMIWRALVHRGLGTVATGGARRMEALKTAPLEPLGPLAQGARLFYRVKGALWSGTGALEQGGGQGFAGEADAGAVQGAPSARDGWASCV